MLSNYKEMIWDLGGDFEQFFATTLFDTEYDAIENSNLFCSCTVGPST